MKELILSTVEKDFILKAIGERKRLDGRQAYDARRMNIQFGVDSGCCVVDLGDTKVNLHGLGHVRYLSISVHTISVLKSTCSVPHDHFGTGIGKMRTCRPADQWMGKLRTRNLRTITADQWVKCGPICADHNWMNLNVHACSSWKINLNVDICYVNVLLVCVQ